MRLRKMEKIGRDKRVKNEFGWIERKKLTHKFNIYIHVINIIKYNVSISLK